MILKDFHVNDINVVCAIGITLLYYNYISIAFLTNTNAKRGLILTGVAPPSLASRGKGASNGGGSMVLVVGAVLGAVVLLVNVLLIACYLHRRSNKRITGGFCYHFTFLLMNLF